MSWRDGYNGIPGKEYARHNEARVLLHRVVAALSVTKGFKREFHPSRFRNDPAALLALVNAHLPEEYAVGMLNELSHDMLAGAARSVARHYGVEPLHAAADPETPAPSAANLAKGRSDAPLAWGNILGQ